jgi:hypothetical protein
MLEGDQDAANKFDGLCECEQFMVAIMTVKHAKRKVRALLFKLQFEGCLDSLEQGESPHTVHLTTCRYIFYSLSPFPFSSQMSILWNWHAMS